jgi:holo-[acyl-carrier protein] synthase|tara:strand:- start:8274 stop:8672 length:399 start_codon:yes stop_codon:yes gene_type:complete
VILGIGTDIVDERRISRLMARFGDRFLDRIFTDAERAEALSRGHAAGLYFAKRFAAKEAVYKALSGSGVDGMGWRDAETTNLAGGAPKLLLTGRCKTALERLAPDGYNAAASLSLSDEPPYAVAFVVISAQR